MSRFTEAAVAALLALGVAASAHADQYQNVGRPATAKEIAAWDIDVRPDFKGLPKGAGTVQKGQDVWEAKCASCHGSFGELNEVFTPIVGGTTKDDVKTGRVAALSDNRQPQRTTLMKVATISTLWDYINRAMPWTAPKSLTPDEVYSVVAYIMYLGEIVPEDYTLSDKNIADAQNLIPNRNGMTTKHGLWDVKAKPDVQSTACMKDCPVESTIRSRLPDSSRNAHGNIAQQNRSFGAVRGADTLKPALTAPVRDGSRSELAMLATQAKAEAPAAKNAASLAKQHACTGCHGVNNKIVGPAFTDIATRYKGDQAAEGKLVERVRKGASGTWGSTPMPPQAQASEQDVKLLVQWILAGAR